MIYINIKFILTNVLYVIGDGLLQRIIDFSLFDKIDIEFIYKIQLYDLIILKFICLFSEFDQPEDLTSPNESCELST